jgi:hypothetical protein
MATNTSLTKELGHGGLTEAPWNSYFDETEEVAALAWPNCIPVYDRMLNDAQIAALMLALLLPIFRYEWYIDPNGAKDQAVEEIANDVGLPILGTDPGPQRRTKGRFNFAEHLKVALPLPLRYGNAFFEQVYTVEDEKLHLRKLAPRMARTISEIVAGPDGGLMGIIQKPMGSLYSTPNLEMFGKSPRQLFSPALTPDFRGIPIPVNRLVAYIHDKEGGNWFGTSILRAIYREWKVKDRLIRVDAIKHERNGMGIPIAKAPENAMERQIKSLQAAVDQIKAAETGGVTIPYGSEITLEGVRGTLPDTLASWQEHNQAISRRFLGMFADLGSTETGSRALGESFVDAFEIVQQSVAEEFVDTFNAYVIEDLIDLNYGEDEQVPKLAFRAEASKELAVADLKLLVDTGALLVDDSIRKYVRDQFDLPDEDPDAREQLAAIVPIKKNGTAEIDDGEAVEGPKKKEEKLPADKAKKKVAASADVQAAAEINGRKLHRDFSEVELASKVDFTAMESTYNGSLVYLIAQWKAVVSQAQIQSLSDQIVASDGNLEKIAAIAAPILGADILIQEMNRVAMLSMAQAVEEARAQGAIVTPPPADELADDIESRAKALSAVMAKSISEAASRKALNSSGNNIPAEDIAATVSEHLNGLSDTFLKDNLGGAVMTAQNDARFAVMEIAEEDEEIKFRYASEILDKVTCGPCKRIDNTSYLTLSDARKDYPTGFYKNCEGGPRCRGTIVAVYKAEAEPSVWDVPAPNDTPPSVAASQGED